MFKSKCKDLQIDFN